MQAFRSSVRVASQFRPTGLPRLVRGYSTEKTYEHLLVSTPKPGVGLSKYSDFVLSPRLEPLFQSSELIYALE